MMNPIENSIENGIENRHAERILSLIVILYGLWLLIPHVEGLIRYTLIGKSFHMLFAECYYSLSRIAAGCCLIVFFPHVVYWIGYFSTKERVRSKRRWSACEFFAIPLVLCGFAVLLLICLFVLDVVVHVGVYYSNISSRPLPEWGVLITTLVFFTPLLLVAVVVVFLRCARLIAAWLLRKVG